MKHAILCLFLFSAVAYAEPPKVDVPAEVQAEGEYVVVNPKTTAKAVTYVGVSGVEPFPAELLRDSKTFMLPTRGLPVGRYTFRGVASLNDEHTKFTIVVVVGKPVIPPVPIIPPGPVPPVPLPEQFGLTTVSKFGLTKQATTVKKLELYQAQVSVASATAAGAYGDDKAKILAGWREANKKAVTLDTGSSENWNEWGKVVSAKIAELDTAGKLPTRKEWADAFNEIAEGLK